MFGIALPLTTVVPARLSSFCRISSDTSLSELIRGTTSSCKATRLNSIFDCCPTFVPVTVLFALTSEDSVLTGTGISVPDAMIAFLLLLVKTTGRLITRKRSEEHTSELQSRGHLVCRLLL